MFLTKRQSPVCRAHSKNYIAKAHVKREYPEPVRRLIYTTNAIEGFNRQLRKVTKSKIIFPSDDSLLKMLYLAMIDITKKWTGTVRIGVGFVPSRRSTLKNGWNPDVISDISGMTEMA